MTRFPPAAAPSDTAAADDRPYVLESKGARVLHFSASVVQSRMQLDDPDALDLEYTRTMMACLLFRPDPRRIAMVGLGGGSLAKFCHRHLPAATIQVAEINPQVLALRDDFAVPPDSVRFEVLLADGARFVRGLDEVLDLLLVDGFDRDGLPEALGSQRFYDDCFASLQPGGLLVQNLHRGDPRHALHVDRLRRSFDDAVLAVDDHDRSNCIVFACKGAPFARHRPGLVPHLPGLAPPAAAALQAAFARVGSALAAARAGAGDRAPAGARVRPPRVPR